MNRIFTTIKQVSATEMSSIEAMSKGYRVNEDSLQIEGYEITYKDGYKSWCPKEVFLENAIISAPEYSYEMPCPENTPGYIVRMHHELNDLREKFIKLGRFINDDKFKQLDQVQQHLLKLQHTTMDAYINILGSRLNYEYDINNIVK